MFEKRWSIEQFAVQGPGGPERRYGIGDFSHRGGRLELNRGAARLRFERAGRILIGTRENLGRDGIADPLALARLITHLLMS